MFLKMQPLWLIPCVCRCYGSCDSRWIWRHWYQSDCAVHITDCKLCMYVQGATVGPYIWKEKENALYYFIRMMKITTGGVVECQGMLSVPEGGHVRCADRIDIIWWYSKWSAVGFCGIGKFIFRERGGMRKNIAAKHVATLRNAPL